MPQQNAENELWAAKPINKEGFDPIGLLFSLVLSWVEMYIESLSKQ